MSDKRRQTTEIGRDAATDSPRPDSDSVGFDDVGLWLAELKAAARGLLRLEGNAGSMHTTQLVNSGLRKLCPKAKDWQEVSWKDREAFFKDAFFAMRRVLIDHARRRAARREVQAGNLASEFTAPLAAAGALDLDRLVDRATSSAELATAVDQALLDLDAAYPGQQLAEIVQHRLFSGLGQMEVATMLGITDRTVRTREHLAYAHLREFLGRFFANP